MESSDPEAVAAAFLTASRALVGLSLRSVAAAPVPLTLVQHRFLVLVSAHGPRRVGSLAEDLGVNQSNASRLTARLIRHGLVERIEDPEDARATLVRVTAAGLTVLESVSRHRLRELRAVVAEMPSSTWATAVEVLRQFNTAAGEADAPIPGDAVAP